jgi:hypothetical protein
VHLTNYSVQKKAPSYQAGDAGAEEGNGNKWTFEHLKAFFEREGISYDETIAKIHDLIVKTVISVEP